MSVYVRPFKKSDLDSFTPLEPIPKGRVADPELAEAIERSGLSVTGIRDGEIFGCGGVHPITDEKKSSFSFEQGELWLRLSKTCLGHRLDTLRWLKSSLKIIEEIYPFRQLNATIRCNFESSIRLVKFLGLKHTEIKVYEGKRWFIFSKRVKE